MCGPNGGTRLDGTDRKVADLGRAHDPFANGTTWGG